MRLFDLGQIFADQFRRRKIGNGVGAAFYKFNLHLCLSHCCGALRHLVHPFIRLANGLQVFSSQLINSFRFGLYHIGGRTASIFVMA